MDQIKQNQLRFSFRLREHAHGPEAWGTAAGAKVFADLTARLLKLTDGMLVVFDYKGIERTDVSFQLEAVVETLRRHRPRLLFIVSNIQHDDVLANLVAALNARGDRLLLRSITAPPRVIGAPLADEHLQTLRVVQEHPGFTSVQLTARPYGLESSTASARLTALWKAGLLGRIQGVAPSGGREYKYFPIQ